MSPARNRVLVQGTGIDTAWISVPSPDAVEFQARYSIGLLKQFVFAQTAQVKVAPPLRLVLPTVETKKIRDQCPSLFFE